MERRNTECTRATRRRPSRSLITNQVSYSDTSLDRRLTSGVCVRLIPPNTEQTEGDESLVTAWRSREQLEKDKLKLEGELQELRHRVKHERSKLDQLKTSITDVSKQQQGLKNRSVL